jgi:hypothetical protein
MKKCCVYFHQGWTDIVICLSLINYYKTKYDEIFVIIRSDAKQFIDYYVRNLQGINIIYINTDNGRYHGRISEVLSDGCSYDNNGNITINSNYDLMFHAEHDIYRKDQYRGYWYIPNKKASAHFSESFYTYYDIDYNVRTDFFCIDRDLILEEKKYQEFIELHGKDYILYHDDQNNEQHGQYHVSTRIEFKNLIENVSYVNLNKKSNIFFDYIKILQNAKEIHLVDSIWAAICYQLDCKYKIFENKNIKIYCKRGHYSLFDSPVKLKNWDLL